MQGGLDRTAAENSTAADIVILRRKWRAALPLGQRLPPYDEVALGSLGRLSDHILLIGGTDSAGYSILRAGRAVDDWLGSDMRGARLETLPPDCVGSLRQALRQSLKMAQPVYATAHRVRDGVVRTYALLAMPLWCRWGTPLVAIYVRELGERYNLVDTIFRSSRDGTLALAALREADGRPIDFQIVTVNEGAAQLLHLPIEQLRWQSVGQLQLGQAAEALLPHLFATLQTGVPRQFEFSGSRDGEDIQLKVGIASLGDLISVTLTDIREVKEREASFRLLFDGNPVPMCLYDPETLDIIAVNEAAAIHYGYSRARFETMCLFDLWPRSEWEPHAAAARAVEDAEPAERTWLNLTADGREIEVLNYARNLVFGQRPAVLVAIVDVTERKQAEARIAFMAHHDALTQLANRPLFHDRLHNALARVRDEGGSLAVHCIDLDHFKSVNDTLGHPLGDQLLQVVAQRLSQAVGKGDLVARLGGDEFAIIQVAVRAPEQAGTLAARLIDVLSEPYHLNGHDIIIGASIGIALAPGDGDAADVLLRDADMALYRAKSEGRGTYHFFEAEMDRRIQARRTMEIDLRKALPLGQFELNYQPLIHVESERVTAFEALLRWRHPDRGMVPPADFVPLAEETGLIVPLGEWVLRAACAEAAHWPADVRVAVNLSPVQFRSRSLVQAVVSALSHARLSPSRLELEITESVLLGETESNLTTLHQLRDLGVRISMDDFGTGYSSLRYLRSFPFDKIKIDRSFVHELVERADCRAIVRAVTSLGASLGIATTAEGVETVEQLHQLRAEGCTEVQGFLFSRPVPAADVARLLTPSPATAASAA